jgi:cytochrome c-type biogenesis protein CcmE
VKNRKVGMNKNSKRRLIIVTFVIVAVFAVIFAVVGGGSAAKTVDVAQALSGTYTDKRVQVTGTVVDDSYTMVDGTLTFSVYDPSGDTSADLVVTYSGATPATFGNGIVAICTGTLDADGSLEATSLVTKCPSKYESAEGALTVATLLADRETMVGTATTVAGYVEEGTLVAAGQGDRFTLTSQGSDVVVRFDGALSDGIADGTAVVVSGALTSDGAFVATSVALDSSV